MKNKKQFTLIELIIVIVVIGILAAMALPKFNGVVRDAKISAMIRDKETLEKTLIMYYQKHDELPLLNEDEELIISNDLSLTKIVLAEEVQSSDMDTIYKSLKETLTYYKDSEDTLYRIDLSKIKNNLSKDIKYGHKKNDKDFYVYSMKTGNVYYYNYLINGNGTIQHNEYDTLLKDNELVTKTISPSFNENEITKDNKPIIELTTNLDNIKSSTIIQWQYKYTDNDQTPTKISFILNGVEYDDFSKIPTTLNDGEYTIKFKAQNSKDIWSNEITKSFVVEYKLSLKENKLSLGENYTMKIGEDENLYTWGYNNHGQLGNGNTTNYSTFQKIILPNDEKPISVAAGYSHSITITDKGNLYTWGYNSDYRLGIGKNSSRETTPQLLTLPNEEKPIDIGLAYSHSMVLTEQGNVYAWGNNNYGQLGLGHFTKQPTPQKVNIPNGEKAVSMEIGDHNSAIITNKGNLYIWGNNDYNQLLTGDKVSYATPQIINLPNNEKPISVKLGWIHIVVLTEKGEVYSWGANQEGQLGIGNNVNQEIPQKVTIPNNEKPVLIEAKNDQTMIITDKGNVYSCGYNYYGQLGTYVKSNINTLTRIYISNTLNFKSVMIGYNHSMIVSENNDIYSFGDNQYGELGTRNSTVHTTPYEVKLP